MSYGNNEPTAADYAWARANDANDRAAELAREIRELKAEVADLRARIVVLENAAVTRAFG